MRKIIGITAIVAVVSSVAVAVYESIKYKNEKKDHEDDIREYDIEIERMAKILDTIEEI